MRHSAKFLAVLLPVLLLAILSAACSHASHPTEDDIRAYLAGKYQSTPMQDLADSTSVDNLECTGDQESQHCTYNFGDIHHENIFVKNKQGHWQVKKP